VTKQLCFLTLLLLSINSTPALSKPLRIVASIKPIHSLLTSITQGVSDVELLMSSRQSPHHYSLRPSERRMLAEADLIFWIGPNLESFMPRILGSLNNQQKVVSLITTPELKLLALRQIDSDHNEHGNNETNHELSKLDAHFWLDTSNTDILVDAITKEIIRLDPEHTQQYLSNSQQLHQKISLLRKELQVSLSAVNKSFLSYHDGYQYFETEFGLDNAGFIASSELQASAHRISELKSLIRKKNIACIFYDAPTEPAIVKSLQSNTKIKTFMLDPVGIFIPPNKDSWFNIMNSLSKQFINCQQNL